MHIALYTALTVFYAITHWAAWELGKIRHERQCEASQAESSNTLITDHGQVPVPEVATETLAALPADAGPKEITGPQPALTYDTWAGELRADIEREGIPEITHEEMNQEDPTRLATPLDVFSAQEDAWARDLMLGATEWAKSQRVDWAGWAYGFTIETSDMVEDLARDMATVR